jgi:hypothetical protein
VPAGSPVRDRPENPCRASIASFDRVGVRRVSPARAGPPTGPVVPLPRPARCPGLPGFRPRLRACRTPTWSKGFAALLAAHAQGPAHLTKRGLALVQSALAAPDRPAAAHGGPDVPAWDRDRRRLTVGGRVVRAVARLAPGQTAVLDALQAAGWPRGGVPNPFRPAGSRAAARRLEYTVKNLNRRLRGRDQRFREDGARVWWAGLRSHT